MDYTEMILHELERVNSIIDMMANPEKYDEKEVLKTASWFGLIPNWNRIEKRGADKRCTHKYCSDLEKSCYDCELNQFVTEEDELKC